MVRKLKVYRTPVGFHDAYVAAPSQKAALAAWGADANLFARGVAEAVTDEALMREPLAEPGTVVRRLRGTNAEHLAALPQDKPDRGQRAVKEAKSGAPAKAKLKPSRAKLDEAEHALDQARTAQEEAIAELRRRETDLQHQRRALEQRYDQDIARLDAAATKARDRYEAALRSWRR